MNAERTGRAPAHFASEAGMPPNPSLCRDLRRDPRRRRRHLDRERARQRHDAYLTDATITEPDMANMTNSRWPNYTPLAIELGACAVFVFPLHVGVEIVGVLTLYRDTAGMLTDEQNADGRELARILPALMTAVLARAPQPLLAGDLIDSEAHRAEVRQAAGATAVQLDIDVDDALIRIRAHANAISKTVAHVSQEILAHGLRLGQDGPQQHGVSP